MDSSLKEQPIRLYAEFLLHISQVTIHATLDLGGHDDSLAYLQSDGRRIAVQYAGSEASINFPNGISGRATAHLPIKAAASISLRLEITEKGEPMWLNGMITANDNPWSAGSFNQETRIACRACTALLITECGSKMIWKDLPRHNWAEMMEFWHCHKPYDSPGQSTQAKPHKFDAAAQPMVTSNVVLIDVCDMIIDRSNAINIELRDDDSSDARLFCTKCRTCLGNRDEHTGGLRLSKWNILVQRSATSDWELNGIEPIMSSQLLSLVEGQVTKKIRLTQNDDGTTDAHEDLLVWILNPDLKYCASYIASGLPRRAMKVLYQSLTGVPSEDPPAVDDEIEARLSPQIFQHLQSALVSSTVLLPETARELQGWNVGLLDRFEET